MELSEAPIGESAIGPPKQPRPNGYEVGHLDEDRATFMAATGLEIEWQGASSALEF